MKIHFDTLAGDKLTNLLCEVGGMIESGTIPVGMLGLSDDSAIYVELFNQIDSSEEEIWFTDKGLGLK